MLKHLCIDVSNIIEYLGTLNRITNTKYEPNLKPVGDFNEYFHIRYHSLKKNR